jgi:tetratricopeptide (TPR) repeat protein
MSHDVFISYARASSSQEASALRDHLKAAGVEAFLDTSDLDAGELFPQALVEAILDARIVALVLDERYLQRWYCLREMRTALGPYDFVLRSPNRTDEALAGALQSVVVLLPDGPLNLSPLPPRLALTHWPKAGDQGGAVALIRARLEAVGPTIRAQLGSMQAFELLRGFIETAALPPAGDAASLIRYKRSPFDLSLGDGFVGRAEELERLHRMVAPREHPAGGDELTAARVAATGGFGKTRLILEYAWRYGTRYYPGGVYWIDGSGSDSALQDQFYEIYKRMVGRKIPALATLRKQKESPRALLEAECRGNKDLRRSLFVVDNIPEASPPQPLRYYCPAIGCSTVIASSRQTTREPGISVLELEPLGRQASVLLLTQRLESADALTSAQWDELARWVGDMPLALELMHWSLSDGAVSPSDLLQLTRPPRGRTDELDVLADALRGQVPDTVLRNVTSLFSASCQALDPGAREAAEILAQFAPVAIPERLVVALGTDLLTPTVRAQLRARHFVSQAGANVFGRMHALMSDFLVKNAGDKADGHWSLASAAVLAVMEARLLKDLDAWDLMSLCEPHATHLFRTGTHAGEPLENSPRAQAAIELGRRAGDFLRARGDLGASRELLSSLVGTAVMLLNSPMAEMNALYSYARTLEELGQWKELLNRLEALFFMGRHTIGLDHPLMLEAKLMQARALAGQGKLTASLEVLSELIESRTAFMDAGVEFPVQLVALEETLGNTLWRAQDYADAATHLKAVLKTYQGRGDEDSEEVLRAKSNLARCLTDLGGKDNLTLARKLSTEVSEATSRLYGLQHRWTIIARSNLSELLLKIGEVDEALRLKEEVLEAARTNLGEDNEDTLYIRRTLAAGYSASKKDRPRLRRILVDLLASERRLGDPDAELTQFLLGKLDENAL